MRIFKTYGAELMPLAVKLLEIAPEAIEASITDEIAVETLFAESVDGAPCVFLATLYRAEQSIAGHIARLGAGQRAGPPIDADKALPWVEKRLSIQLAHSQKTALRRVVAAKLLVVTAVDADEDELAVDFDGRTVRYPYGELDQLVLC